MAKRQSWSATDLFLRYYVLGPNRSLARLRESLAEEFQRPPNLTTLKRFSRDHDWQRRLAELDDQHVTAQLVDHQRTVTDMNMAQASLGALMQTVSVAVVRRYIENGSQGVTLNEAVALAREGSKLERLALGEVTDRRDIAISFYNRVIVEVIAIFDQVLSAVPKTDREKLTAEFATRVDAIGQGFIGDIEPGKVGA